MYQPYVPRTRRRHLTTVSSLVLALFAVSQAHAGKPPLPIPGQLPPATSGLDVEPVRPRPVPTKAGIVDTGQVEQLVEPAGGGYVSLKNVPPTKRVVEDAAPRSHTQGGDAADALDRAAPGAAPFRKAASSPPSPPPQVGLAKDAGNHVRTIDGINDHDSIWIPPDMVIAVGPSHVVEAVNAGFSVYTKFGTPVTPSPDGEAYWTFSDFFDARKPAGWEGFMFDPRLLYDANRDRFVMLALGKDEVNETSYFFLALSETSDPTGDWCTRRIDSNDTGGASPAWLDYAGLGVDQWGLYVTGNLIYWTGGKRGAQIRSFDTAIFDDCTQPLTTVKFPNVKWPSGAQADSLQPAHPHTNNSNEETFFVGTYSGSGDEVLLAKLSGNRSNSPTLTKVAIDIPAYDAIGSNVDQPGTATDLDGGASKVQNAVYVNRHVFFALTDDVNNDGSSSGWLTVKLNTDQNTMEWHDLLWSGEGYYYFYPALTVQGTNPDNNVAVFGSWTDTEVSSSAAQQYASGLFKLYENQPNDSSGTFIGSPLGVAPYVKLDRNGRNRWGDYGGAAYDWTCGHAWGVVESADTANQWKTTIIAREFDNEGECPLVEVSAPEAGAALVGGDTVTVQWLAEGLPATDEIYVYVFADSGVFTVAEGLPSSYRSVSWTVPEAPAEEALLSVGSWDGSQYTAVAWSQPFSLVDRTPPSPDPASWHFPPSAESPTNIRMTATEAIDGSGGEVEREFDFTGSPTGGAGGTGTGWISYLTFNNSSLDPNHEYCYRTRSRDEAGNVTAPSPTECIYTLAADPAPAGFDQVTGLSVRVNWDTSGNAPYTEYVVEGQPGNLDSGPVTGNRWTATGLAADVEYTFRIRTRNRNGIANDWVDLGSVTTLADDPDGDGVPALADNCLNVSNPAQRDTDGDAIGNSCDPDFDNNCSINFGDLAYLKQEFLGNDPDADLNGDGSVNFGDLAILKAMFLAEPGPAAMPNVCHP